MFVCKTQNNCRLVFFVAVADIAAQIRHVNSLEAITDLHVCGSVLAPEILGT